MNKNANLTLFYSLIKTYYQIWFWKILVEIKIEKYYYYY